MWQVKTARNVRKFKEGFAGAFHVGVTDYDRIVQETRRGIESPTVALIILSGGEDTTWRYEKMIAIGSDRHQSLRN